MGLIVSLLEEFEHRGGNPEQVHCTCSIELVVWLRTTLYM